MASATSKHSPVEEYLEMKMGAGRIVQVPPEYGQQVQISRLGVIPKPNQPGKWHLILAQRVPVSIAV